MNWTDPAKIAGKGEHLTGHEKAWKEGSYDIGIPTGPFGTLEKPVLIKSIFDTRIVGCVGELSVFIHL